MAKARSITRGQRSAEASMSMSTSAPGSPVTQPGTPAGTAVGADAGPVLSPTTEARARRLAEMVAGLTETPAPVAAHYVRSILVAEPGLDSLEVVARAVVAVEAPETDRFRIPAYVDPTRRLAGVRAARRARAAQAAQAARAARPRPEPALVSSGSCDATEWTDDVIFDLRVEHARVRIDLTKLDRTHRRRRR
jgi:hypothetical protein